MGADKLRSAAVLAGAAVLLLTSCATEEPTEEAAEQPAAPVAVDAQEYEFDPADVVATADQDVDVTFTNSGELPHEWVVLEAGTEIGSEGEFSEDLIAFELEADPGGSASGTLNLPAGSHQVICAVPGHFSAGMEGGLTLE